MRDLTTVLVTDKESGQSVEVGLEALGNLTNSVIMLSVGPEEIASIEAQSGNLVITLKSGETIVMEGFFAPDEAQRNELILKDSSGLLWWGQYDSPWSEFSFTEINPEEVEEGSDGIGWWLLAALAAVGIAAAAGSSSSSSSSSPTDPDPTPAKPDAPTVDSVTNNFNEQGEPTGTTVTGKAEPGHTVEIRDKDGNFIGGGEADEDGNFEIITDEPLADGEEYDVVAIDEDDNVSDPTPITGDLTPPNVTVEDLVTNEVAPELSGTIDDPDATVQVTIGDATHEATNNGDGTWSLTWPEALGEDDYTVEVEATDPAGNTGTAQGDLTIDTTAPDTPVITGAVDDVEPAGDLADGDVTNDSTPTLEGTAEADSTVTLFQDGTEIGTTTADGDGNWSFEVPALTDDTFVFTATATDAAGNVSEESDSFALTIDTVAPDAPTLELANDTGDVDGVTSDGTVSVGGLEEGATWEYSTDGGETWTEGEGTSFVLPEGTYEESDVLARQTDEAGNTSGNGELGAVTVDTTSPGGDDGTDAPVLAIADADNGFINADELADGIQAVVTLTDGTQEGDTVTVTLTDAEGVEHSFEHTVTADDLTEGEVSLTLDGDFAEGDASAVAVITDEAGNSSADSNAVAFEIDTEAPDAPTLELANDTGDVDGVTSDGTVSVGGLEEGATWEYSTDGGETWTEGEGTSFVLPEGTYEESDVLARQTDEAGNTSGNGELGAVTVDTTAPDAPTAEFNDTGDAVTGEAEPGSTVTVYDEDGNELGSTTADADDGSYTVEIDPALTDGEEVTVTATDEAGNESAPAPATAPQAADAPTLSLLNDTGTDGDGITSDGTIEVEGLVAGATWEYSTDGGTTWTEGEGTSFELPVGEYDDGAVIARQTVDGLTSPAGELGEVTVMALNAVDDSADLDMGDQAVVVHTPETEESVQVVGVAEGDVGIDAGTTFIVSEDHVGEVAIEVNQVALVAVADAFRLEIYDADGNLVYTGVTENSLVGDVGGVETLGLTGDDTLVAVLDGLAPGEYSVVVRNEASELAELLGEGLTLEELGEAGVVLGPDNQDAVLDAVEEALNGIVLGGVVQTTLGTFVRGILETALETTEALGAGELVSILTGPLDGLGITGVLDTVVDAIAEELLSNTLTAFQFTDITTTVTEYSFAANQPVEGNVITGDAGVGEDELVPGSEVSQVQLLDAEGNPSGDAVTVPESGSVEIAGLYGVLTIFADGSYSYAANGDRASLGESDTFTYTVSDGLNEASANLTIEIDGEALPGLDAQSDSVDLDMGDQSAVVHEPQTDSDVQVLGLLEGDSGEISGVDFTVSDDQLGEMTIQVSQTALVAVADAFVIEVVDAEGNVVFTAVTPDNPLVGDVAGLGILGLTGDDTLSVTATGLPPGDYTVVVRNDSSAVSNLLTELSLEGLGEAGVILGPENQELVLDAVDAALGGNALSGTVRGILELTLNTLNGLGVDSLVDVLTDTLTVLGLSGLVEDVLDAVGGALVSNTLTLLQSTEVTTTLTEYAFGGDLAASGNVITGAGEGDVADGIAQGGVVTQVENADGEVVAVLGTGAEGVTIEGEYGVLTIYEDGSYTYDASGARAGLGQSETFTYTVTNGAFNPDGSRITESATLTINIDGQGTAGDVAFAGVEYDFTTTDGLDEPGFVSDSWLIGIGSSTEVSAPFIVEAGTTQDITLDLGTGDLLSLLGGTTIALQSRVDGGAWQTIQEFSDDQLVGLLGLLGGGDEFVIPGLTEGEYRLSVTVTGISLGGSYSVDLTSTVTLLDEFEVDSVATAEGNLLENDVLRGEEFELLVSTDGTNFESTAGGPVTLTGEHGSLTIEADGSYVYTPNDLAHFTETLSETFTYQLGYGDGVVEEAELTVFVEPSGAGVDEDMAGTDQGSSADLQAFMVADDGIDLEIDAITEEGVIDLRGNGADRLELASDEVLELSDADNILVIQGDEEDTLNIAAESWEEGGSVLQDGLAYTQYTFDDTTLLVQEGVNVEVS